ncbi:MAG: iron ABC transporter permease, partial [Vicinamibacterales bacterium]|nr:iron ABC transporter permease [Vicinamibacterales bacterium]
DGAWDVIGSARVRELLVRTLALTFAVTVTALAIAVPLAWATVRTDLPLRRTWTVFAALPLAIPTYVGGYAFVAALGPRGLMQGWLEPFGVEQLPSIYGFPGAWLTLTLFTYPYAFLTVRAAVQRLDVSLEEASRSLGHGGRATFRKVVLPQLRLSIGAGALLVALYTLHDFGAVSFLRFDSFTRAIYLEYQSSFDRSRAALLSLVLVAVALTVVAIEARRRVHIPATRGSQAGARPVPIAQLGRWKWPAFAGCCALVGLGLALPVGVIGWLLVQALRAHEPIRLGTAALHSVEAAGLAAVAATIAAWPVAMLVARHPGRLTRLIERASFVGYALPGLVVALAFVFVGARYLSSLYQTLTMLVLAYVVLFLPQAVGALRVSITQVSISLEEAAASLGSGRYTTLRRVMLPLARPGLLAGCALVFLTALKELPATLLLAPIEFSTLATEVWDATAATAYTQAAAPALVLIALGALPLALSVWFSKSTGR